MFTIQTSTVQYYHHQYQSCLLLELIGIFFLDEVVRLKEETDAAPSTEAFNATGINEINFGITIQPLSQDSEDMIGKELVNLIDHS